MKSVRRGSIAQSGKLKKSVAFFMLLVSFIFLCQFRSVVFSQSGSVSGIVLDKQTNAPLGGVQVFFYEPNLNLLESTTANADGTFLAPVLPAGHLQVSVTAKGYAQSVQAEIDLTSGQQINNIKILLSKEAQLTGKVMSSAGQPILHAEIFAQSTDEKSSGFTASASDGSFKVFGLDAGSFKVTIKAKGFLSSTVENVSLQNEQTGMIPDVQLQAAGRMTVDVLDNSGQAFPDAEITVEGGEVFKTATSDVQGKAEFPELPFGDYTVTIDSLGYIPSTGSYNVTSYDPPTSVQAQLQKGASIVGHVYASDGVTPISGADIVLFGSTGVNTTSSTADDGSYSFNGLPAGAYQIDVSIPDSFIILSQQNIMLSGMEEKTINFVLPATGTIKGKIFLEDGVTPAANAIVAAIQTDGDKKGVGVEETNINGEYEIKNLLPGTYTVTTENHEQTKSGQTSDVAVIANQITDNINLNLSP